MPALNLPNLNFNIDSGTDKQTLEQIVDSLSKYRKELNFLLMNLDTDNMPVVAGLIEDAFGNMSSISQTVDAINLTVSNAVGDISNLQIQSNSISSIVADNSNNISSLTITSSQIQSIVASNTGNISSIIQKANVIETQVATNTGQLSSVIQTAQGLETRVTNNTGAISTVTQTVNGIQSTVISQGTAIGTVQSSVTQLASSISSKVSWTDYRGSTIVSLIEQSPSSIKLSASRIDLTGITTLYGANTGDKVVVNSGRIDMYMSGSNLLRFDYALNGGAISSPSGNRIVIDDALMVSGITSFNGNTYFFDNVDFSRLPDFNGKPLAYSNRELYINQTSYGIDIRSAYYNKSITLAWT